MRHEGPLVRTPLTASRFLPMGPQGGSLSRVTQLLTTATPAYTHITRPHPTRLPPTRLRSDRATFYSVFSLRHTLHDLTSSPGPYARSVTKISASHTRAPEARTRTLRHDFTVLLILDARHVCYSEALNTTPLKWHQPVHAED
jgi:hypothetical protein